jgi:hypothetical protein
LVCGRWLMPWGMLCRLGVRAGCGPAGRQCLYGVSALARLVAWVRVAELAVVGGACRAWSLGWWAGFQGWRLAVRGEGVEGPRAAGRVGAWLSGVCLGCLAWWLVVVVVSACGARWAGLAIGAWRARDGFG